MTILDGRKDERGVIARVRRAEIELLNARATEELARLETLRCAANYKDAMNEMVGTENDRPSPQKEAA